MSAECSSWLFGIIGGGGDPHPLTVQKSGDLHLGCMKPCK